MVRSFTPFLVGEWKIEPETGIASYQDERVHLEPKAVELLCCLASKPGDVVSREELLDSVWPGVTVGDEVITNAIAKLRRAFHDDLKSAEFIQTIPKRGYRLVSPVTLEQPTSSNDGKPEGAEQTGPANRRSWLLPGAVIVAIIISVVFWQRQQNVDVDTIKPTIAVLPFDNFSDDKNQEYFSDGLTEDLITDISKISGISVIARHSTFSYKGQSPDIREVGIALGATHVIEGSVRKAGDNIRISVQLIDAANGKHLWAERYDRQLKDVFAIQDEVIDQIILALSLKLKPDEATRLAHRGTENLEAYDLYMRGREQESFFNKAAFVEAQSLYEQAIALDGQYAYAYAHLAQIHTMNGQFVWVDDIKEADAIALNLAQKSVRLDPTMPFARWGLSRILTRDSINQNDRAIEEMEKAIELDPSYADAYAFLGLLYIYDGRAEESLPLLERAMKINPNFPFWYYFGVGLAQFFMGDYQASIENLEISVERNPAVFFTRQALAAALAMADRQDDAEWQIEELIGIGYSRSLKKFAEDSVIHDKTYLKLYVEGLSRAGLK
jgi:TolB-like protein/DNA-binding winged helix-turn-helix (wHTH) protein